MAWAPDYVTTAEAKAYLRITDTDDDAQVALAVTAASRAIDRHCNRQFGQVAEEEQRYYTSRWDRRLCRWVIDVDDFTGTPTVATVEGALTVATFTAEDINAPALGRPYTRIVVSSDSANKPTGERNDTEVSALWGWTAVPEAVKEACHLQMSRFFTRRNAPFGVAGSPESGSEMRLLARVDPDVAVILGPFVRWWAAA